jgi:hypothetical protein
LADVVHGHRAGHDASKVPGVRRQRAQQRRPPRAPARLPGRSAAGVVGVCVGIPEGSCRRRGGPLHDKVAVPYFVVYLARARAREGRARGQQGFWGGCDCGDGRKGVCGGKGTAGTLDAAAAAPGRPFSCLRAGAGSAGSPLPRQVLAGHVPPPPKKKKPHQVLAGHARVQEAVKHLGALEPRYCEIGAAVWSAARGGGGGGVGGWERGARGGAFGGLVWRAGGGAEEGAARRAPSMGARRTRGLATRACQGR